MPTLFPRRMRASFLGGRIFRTETLSRFEPLKSIHLTNGILVSGICGWAFVFSLTDLHWMGTVIDRRQKIDGRQWFTVNSDAICDGKAICHFKANIQLLVRKEFQKEQIYPRALKLEKYLKSSSRTFFFLPRG